MEFIFCFVPPGTLYPHGGDPFEIDLLVYEQQALDNNEEADFSAVADAIFAVKDIYEDCEFCYTLKDGVTQDQIRQELITLGLRENNQLLEHLADLPI